MSKRNTQQAKTAARERLRAERERQAKKDKARRQAIVGVSIVGVLAVAAGAGFLVMQANKPTAWEAAKEAKLVAPANTSGKNGTTVVVGKAGAKKTLELYEDPRCPICASFEQGAGEQVKKDVADGKYKVQFFGASFIDNAASGEGSKNALSALGAALNVSDDAFLDYKSALYSAKNHPEENDDKFKDDAALIKIADEVPELKGNKKFQKAVEDGTFDKWALEMSAAFDKSGVSGTPTLKMDGKKLEVDFNGQKGTPMTAEQLTQAVDKALKA
ncbi:thioredoxin domain-containing protein [Streptomyces boluensis]|uniref:Thioredoxin domain-containing protein n=1 Tax=Streptomyces boluensis TaxID=1775135 RepID=A0A964XND9_9ACTN|nr:thioredoxin domain-containing protein [Streptomyces boluensis]NBE53483.1 thioredoxin domain-containing protein [Streptomyces boluensis]